MNNLITTWQQGRFVDQPQYSRWTAEEKAKADHDEKYRVRPDPTGNAIATACSHDEAEWIAQRLNLAATLEQMAFDFATGKTDGSEIVALVKKSIG